MGDLTNISACPNCGHEPFDTPFCPECGQRRLREKDFSIYSLTGDFFHGVLNLENSFFTTLKDFFLRPSKYLDEYNHGARKKYISPIKLFLVANAFYFLFPAINTFTTSLRIQMNGLLYSNFMRGFIQGRITASELNAEQFHTEYNELTATLSKALLLFLPLVFGLITWLLSFTKTKKAPLIFHINRSLGLHAFILFIVVSIVPGVFYYTAHILQSEAMLNSLSEFNITLFSFLAMNIYGYFVYRNFFRTSLWVSILRAALLNVLFFYLIFLYRFFLLMVTLGWMALFR